jgi:chromosome segregation protein
MGESSPKSMRGGGMEDVIFAGTVTRPARDFAEVTLFTERPDAEDDEEREVEVTRRIERGAGSAYRMNGRDVRQKDVGLLFADAATGAHSPALVSQGRIAGVIAAKPAERRQMLEEAAGIAGLHVRRKDAEQKLRATETNLARLDDLIADMEARTGSLRRQARAAERYKALSEQIRIAEARLIYSRWRDAAEAAEAAREEATMTEALVAKAAEAQKATTARQAEITRKVGDARSAAQTARERSTSLAHRLATLQGELESVHRRLADIAQSRDTLSRDRAREDRLAIDAAAALKALAEEEKELGRRIEEATARRAATDSLVREAESEARDAELAVAKAQAAYAAEQADMRVAQANVTAARQRLDRAQNEAQRIARELAGLGDEAPLIARRHAARKHEPPPPSAATRLRHKAAVPAPRWRRSNPRPVRSKRRRAARGPAIARSTRSRPRRVMNVHWRPRLVTISTRRSAARDRYAGRGPCSRRTPNCRPVPRGSPIM